MKEIFKCKRISCIRSSIFPSSIVFYRVSKKTALCQAWYKSVVEVWNLLEVPNVFPASRPPLFL
jgi:hypothetical protein